MKKHQQWKNRQRKKSNWKSHFLWSSESKQAAGATWMLWWRQCDSLKGSVSLSQRVRFAKWILFNRTNEEHMKGLHWRPYEEHHQTLNFGGPFVRNKRNTRLSSLHARCTLIVHCRLESVEWTGKASLQVWRFFAGVNNWQKHHRMHFRRKERAVSAVRHLKSRPFLRQINYWFFLFLNSTTSFARIAAVTVCALMVTNIHYKWFTSHW